MKYRNKAHNPGMEFTLPNGMRIVAYMSGKAEPGRHDADWSGICVAMVAPNGDMLPLCSTEYVERDHKVRVFGHNGRINELDVSIEKAPQKRRRQEAVPGNASFRLRMA